MQSQNDGNERSYLYVHVCQSCRSGHPKLNARGVVEREWLIAHSITLLTEQLQANLHSQALFLLHRLPDNSLRKYVKSMHGAQLAHSSHRTLRAESLITAKLAA